VRRQKHQVSESLPKAQGFGRGSEAAPWCPQHHSTRLNTGVFMKKIKTVIVRDKMQKHYRYTLVKDLM